MTGATSWTASFWERVDRRGPVKRPGLGRCWEWTGAMGGGVDGEYGAFSAGGRLLRAHRVAFELAGGTGAILPGFDVMHRCDNRKCVRPSHLRLGSRADNNRDCAAKGRRCAGRRQLTREAAEAARALWTNRGRRGRSARGETIETLAARFGVSYAAMRDALLGRTWT